MISCQSERGCGMGSNTGLKVSLCSISFTDRFYNYTFPSDQKKEGGVRKKDKEVNLTTFNMRHPSNLQFQLKAMRTVRTRKTTYAKKVVRYQGRWHEQKWAQCNKRTGAEIDFQVILGLYMGNEMVKPLREANL